MKKMSILFFCISAIFLFNTIVQILDYFILSTFNKIDFLDSVFLTIFLLLIGIFYNNYDKWSISNNENQDCNCTNCNCIDCNCTNCNCNHRNLPGI